MRNRITSQSRPPSFTVEQENDLAAVRFYTDILEDADGAYSAIEWTTAYPYEADIETKISNDYAGYLSAAQNENYIECAYYARQDRDRLLKESDYVFMTDYPLPDAERAAWSAYRQVLRDAPEQPGFPFEIEWPQLPQRESETQHTSANERIAALEAVIEAQAAALKALGAIDDD